jgi:hypothetical protein
MRTRERSPAAHLSESTGRGQGPAGATAERAKRRSREKACTAGERDQIDCYVIFFVVRTTDLHRQCSLSQRLSPRDPSSLLYSTCAQRVSRRDDWPPCTTAPSASLEYRPLFVPQYLDWPSLLAADLTRPCVAARPTSQSQRTFD